MKDLNELSFQGLGTHVFGYSITCQLLNHLFCPFKRAVFKKFGIKIDARVGNTDRKDLISNQIR